MSKIKAFFYIFSKSLTSPEYYKDVVSSEKKLSIKYFFSLALLASLITSVHTLVPLIPKVKENLINVVQEAVNIYEDDLIITAEDGEISVNKPEPYIVPFPWEENFTPDTPKNLIVFDKNGTVDDFLNKYDSLAMINSSNLILRNQSGIRVESLEQVPDGSLTKDDILRFASKVENVLVYVPYLLSFFVFFGVFAYYAFLRFVYVFIVAAFLFVFGKIKKLDYRYQDYLKISIHTFTLPLVIEIAFRFVDPAFLARVPMWFFMVNVLFGVFIVLALVRNRQDLVKKSA